MHYLLFYDVSPDHLTRRAEFRAAHLALADPLDGAVLLFRGDSAAAAERFAAGGPARCEGRVMPC